MIKTATDGRLLPSALAAGAALSAMAFASRLPATLDFILPRRAGWPLFALAHEVLSRPGPRAAFSAAVTVLLAGAVIRAVWVLAAAARGRRWSLGDFLVRGLALSLTLALTRWSFSVWLEVSQKVWFPFGGLNPWEPAANLLVFSAVAFAAASAARACVASGAGRLLAAWALVNTAAALAAMGAYGAWRTAAPPAEGRRLFVVLTEEEGRPGKTAYDLPVPAEAPLKPRSVGRLEALRARYERAAMLMDPAGLRSALLLGVAEGDELARSLLLAHLRAAPPSPEALAALGALADETAHRVGAIGASRLALAYAHLGDPASASSWARRAAAAPRGIPEGLLDLSGDGALKAGRIAGRVAGLRPLRAALYRRDDAAAPYLLDAAALVASGEPDAKGRFSFEGLPAGRYYLAFAFEPRPEEIVVRGHRGDASLDARRPSVDLPLLTFAAAAP